MSKTYSLAHETARERAIDHIKSLPVDCSTEIVIRKAQKSKTMQQLGALFGLWAEYVSEQTGYTVNELHGEWKRQFLARIYCETDRDEMSDQVAIWVELLIELQLKNDWNAVSRHADRISLAWASIKQVRKYMDSIQNYYISINMPLPIPDKFAGSYR